MNYLVIGSGGREHALAWRLKQDGSASRVYVAPGNGGILPENQVNINPLDFNEVAKACLDKKIDVVLVGPEAPLVEGLVDFLEKEKIPVFGPTKKAAQLEGSKLFAKSIMEKYDIPTAGHKDFKGPEKLLDYLEEVSSWPIVIKLDGLAAGKGVCLPENKEETLNFIKENVNSETKIFVEDFLEGEEVSVFGISDGKNVLSFLPAQDHKRIFEGDQGPNTGGMGAYAPTPLVGEGFLQEVEDKVLKPTILGMEQEGFPFKGVLYAGLIVKEKQIKVLEYNVRFGDPEIQALLPLLDNRLGEIIEGSINGSLDKVKLSFKDKKALTVVLASGGYPGGYEKGKEITGIDQVDEDILVFHAGTKEENGQIYTNGGRVLNVTALDVSLSKAKDKVYQAIEKINFDKMFYRKDIAYRAFR